MYIMAVVLILIWLLGLVTGTTGGGFIHMFLVLALILTLLQLISTCDVYDEGD